VLHVAGNLFLLITHATRQNPDLPEKSVFHVADPKKPMKTPINHANHRYREGAEE
jgi:hypothetical protein